MLIREFRLAKKMSQKDLAKELGITPAYLCELEKGKKKNPNIALVARIAEILEINTDELLKEMQGTGK